MAPCGSPRGMMTAFPLLDCANIAGEIGTTLPEGVPAVVVNQDEPLDGASRLIKSSVPFVIPATLVTVMLVALTKALADKVVAKPPSPFIDSDVNEPPT